VLLIVKDAKAPPRSSQAFRELEVRCNVCAIIQSMCGIRNACLLFQSERRADPAVRIRESVVSLLNKTQSVHVDDLFFLIDECLFAVSECSST
jgi:hypothetical protein